MLTIQPGTGYVKALVGGRNYSKTQFNRAIQARRQPGSLFKPFVYVTAMDPARGQQALTAATVLDDSPITVRTGNAVWQPQNYDLVMTLPCTSAATMPPRVTKCVPGVTRGEPTTRQRPTVSRASMHPASPSTR